MESISYVPLWLVMDTIALPLSCWGNVHTWGSAAFLTAPTGRQALAPEAGRGKAGSWKKQRIILMLSTANFHVRFGAWGLALWQASFGVRGDMVSACPPLVMQPDPPSQARTSDQLRVLLLRCSAKPNYALRGQLGFPLLS